MFKRWPLIRGIIARRKLRQKQQRIAAFVLESRRGYQGIGANVLPFAECAAIDEETEFLDELMESKGESHHALNRQIVKVLTEARDAAYVPWWRRLYLHWGKWRFNLG